MTQSYERAFLPEVNHLSAGTFKMVCFYDYFFLVKNENGSGLDLAGARRRINHARNCCGELKRNATQHDVTGAGA